MWAIAKQLAPRTRENDGVREFPTLIKYKFSDDAVTQIIRHSFAFPNDYRVINENRLNNVYANNAEFAYDQAMSIGCGYSNNPCFTESTKTVIACGITPLKHTGAPTFTIGCSPCKEDRDCNKTNYNKCDTSLGLCYA